MGLAGAHRVHLGDDAGEFPAGSFHLDPRLDDVLHRCDPDAFAGTSDVKLHVLDAGLHIAVGIDEVFDILRANVQNAVFDYAFV